MLNRHGLILRLMIPLGIMVAMVLIVLTLSHRAGRAVAEADAAVIATQRHALALEDLRSISRALQRDALNLVTEPSQRELTSIRARFDRRVSQFEDELAKLQRDPTTETPAEFGEYTRTQALVLASLRNLRQTAERDRSRALTMFGHEVRPNERRASTIADRMIDRIRTHQAALSAAAAQVAAAEWRSLYVLTALFSAIAIAVGLLVIGITVIRPLAAIRRAMEALAAGDATVAIPATNRLDAIGTMARAIEVFRDATRERDGLRALRESERAAAADARHRDTAQVAQRAALEEQRRDLLNSLADAVENSLSTVNGKLRTSAERLNRSADDVARYAATAGSEAELTSQAAEQVTHELAATSAATSQMAHTAAGLHATALQATEAVQTAVSRSRDAAHRVAGMSSYADRVEELTALIASVSEQSQLLALNATIEAARAGETGKGFGVVANEMKRLSAQTAAAAENVEAEMDAIRAAASEGMTAIAEIGDAMGQIESNAELVVRSIREQDSANAEVGRGVAAALFSVSMVGERMAALGSTALGTRDVAGTLLSDAEVLSADAAGVDTALRDLVSKLRAA